MKKILILLIIGFIVISGSQISAISLTHYSEIYDPTPPGQPSSGPGGSDYSHNDIIISTYKSDAEQYWIFEPDDPKPESAPLIVINHGYSAMYPYYYQEWINHTVKKGNIVVYPRYQKDYFITFNAALNNCINSVKDAIINLQSEDHVHPELDKFAITGHSFGGGITAMMAANAAETGIPIPSAIMILHPYFSDNYIEELNKISPDTLMLVIVAEEDTVVGDKPAKKIFNKTPQIPKSQKDYIIQLTDTYGSPDIIANHNVPVAFPNNEQGTIDALDYYSVWKLFDALSDFAFYDINEEYCLGNTSEQRFMGLWSDGTPVNEMIVPDDPGNANCDMAKDFRGGQVKITLKLFNNFRVSHIIYTINKLYSLFFRNM